MPAGARRRIKFHPACYAHYGRQAVAGGITQHVGLHLLRLDHRHHRRRRADSGRVAQAVGRIKRHTKLPVCVGFGVRTAEQARAMARDADGVVVGSALVEAVRTSLDGDGKPTAATAKSVADLVRALAAGVRSAQRVADTNVR